MTCRCWRVTSKQRGKLRTIEQSLSRILSNWSWLLTSVPLLFLFFTRFSFLFSWELFHKSIIMATNWKWHVIQLNPLQSLWISNILNKWIYSKGPVQSRTFESSRGHVQTVGVILLYWRRRNETTTSHLELIRVRILPRMKRCDGVK